MAIVQLITVVEGSERMSYLEVCSLSPVCASSGETAHRSVEPATGHRAASAQERTTHDPDHLAEHSENKHVQPVGVVHLFVSRM